MTLLLRPYLERARSAGSAAARRLYNVQATNDRGPDPGERAAAREPARRAGEVACRGTGTTRAFEVRPQLPREQRRGQSTPRSDR